MAENAQTDGCKALTPGEKIRLAKLGKPRSVEHDAAIRAGNFGRPLTEAEIKQRREASKGKSKKAESIRKRSDTVRRLNREWFDGLFSTLAKAKRGQAPT